MENDKKLDLRDLIVDQFGYVYKDIEKQAQIMENMFNMPKFNFLPPITLPVTYRGKATEMTVKVGFSTYFNLQIELIQLIEGQNIYKDFLDQGKEGFHHLGCTVKGTESYLDHFKDLGIEVVFSGIIPPRMFAYLDTEDILGIILELKGPIQRKKKEK